MSEETIGISKITENLNRDLSSDIKVGQVRKVLTHLNLPTKITNSEYSIVKDFYGKHNKKEIRNILTEHTCMLKYGVSNPAKSDIVKKRLKDVYKNKTIEQKEQIERKRAETNKKLFGYEYPNQRPEAINRAKVNWKNNPEKSRQTCKLRYGVDNYSKTDQFKIKQAKFLESKEGLIFRQKASNRLRNVEKEQKAVQTKKAKDTLELNRLLEKTQLEKQENLQLIDLQTCAKTLDRDLSTFGYFVVESNLKRFVGKYRTYISLDDFKWCQSQYEKRKIQGTSSLEIEIFEFLRSNFKGEILQNQKSLLNNKHLELDIYIPKLKLAIEFNGNYYHSDLALTKKGEIPDEESRHLTKNRHINKTELCNQAGIQLIHVFEDDWIYRKSIVKSLLLKRLGLVKKVYARNCVVRNLDVKTYRNFLVENHLQGYSVADLRLGLFYENELLELIGIRSKGNHSKNPELVRLCTKKNFQVLGGFSKLLKHTELDVIDSYVDIGTFNGEGYQTVGFQTVKVNKPTYFYIKRGTCERLPRYTFMRSNIEKLYDKGVLRYFNPNETEEVNMYKNDYGRIWNCGTKLVRWIKS